MILLKRNLNYGQYSCDTNYDYFIKINLQENCNLIKNFLEIIRKHKWNTKIHNTTVTHMTTMTTLMNTSMKIQKN